MTYNITEIDLDQYDFEDIDFVTSGIATCGIKVEWDIGIDHALVIKDAIRFRDYLQDEYGLNRGYRWVTINRYKAFVLFADRAHMLLFKLAV